MSRESKQLIVLITAALAFTLLMYMTGSFIAASWSISDWPKGLRYLIGGVWSWFATKVLITAVFE